MAGHVKRFTRMLLECNSNDKLCVVREYQTEVIVVPVLLVGFFVIVLTVILWLHCRGLRAKQEQSSSSGHQVNDKNQQESSSTENRYIQLSETSVESLLNSASLTLKELEIPREKLSPGTLQLIKHGCCGSIYRAQLEIGNPGKTKTVVLKALQGEARGLDPLWYTSLYQRHDAGQNFAVITGQEQAVFSIMLASQSDVLVGMSLRD